MSNLNLKYLVKSILSENDSHIDITTSKGVFDYINVFPKKLKFDKGVGTHLDDNPLQTAISNSEIKRFYENYMRINFKKYVNSIPFPFSKMNREIEQDLNKLNILAHIFNKHDDLKSKLAVQMCLQLMGHIIMDLYFDIKTRRYDIYQTVKDLEIPTQENYEKVLRDFTDKEHPANYINFYSLTDNIYNLLRSQI